jgi:Protein of unknown function (DUF4089)
MPTQALELWVDATAAAVGLKIASEHRPGVVRYARLAAGFAEQVMAFDLKTTDEAATVFIAVEALER